MVKKFFPFFLVIIFLIVIFSYYKKNNQSVKKIFDSKKTELTSPANLNSTDKPTSNSGKIFLEIIEPKNNITLASQSISVSGKTISNGFVFVNDQEFKADTKGNFSTTVILDEGENDIIVVASDSLGNSLEKDIIVNLESTN